MMQPEPGTCNVFRSPRVRGGGCHQLTAVHTKLSIPSFDKKRSTVGVGVTPDEADCSSRSSDEKHVHRVIVLHRRIRCSSARAIVENRLFQQQAADTLLEECVCERNPRSQAGATCLAGGLELRDGASVGFSERRDNGACSGTR